MSVAGIVGLMAGGAALGAVACVRLGDRAERASRRVLDLLLWVVLPPILFVLATRIELDLALGAGLLLAYVVLGVVGVVAWTTASRVLGLPAPAVGAVVVCAILANTGYLGLPLSAALLGGDGLGPAIAWDSLVSGPMFYGVAFAVGAALGTPVATAGRGTAAAHAHDEPGPAAGEEAGGGAGTASGVRVRLRAVAASPLLWAVVLGLLVPDALAPDGAVELARDVLLVVLVVGFAVVGVQLTAEARAEGLRALRITRPVGVVVALRLGLAPALVLGAGLLLVDLPRAFALQAAMPCGLNALVVCHAFRLDLRVAAAAIAWTHLLVGLAALVGPLVG